MERERFDAVARQVLSKIKSTKERVCNNSPQEKFGFGGLFPDNSEMSGRTCALDIVTTTSAGPWRERWSEIWETIGPMLRSVYETRKAT
jgi:hypothetical protein